MTSRPLQAALLCLAATISCGGEAIRDDSTPAEARDDATPAEARDDEAPADPDSTIWTIGRRSGATTVTGGPLPVLTALRTGTHPEHVRLTVEIGDAEGLPGYRVEYIDRPLHECGSGRQIFPVGDAWLELRLEPAAAHTEAGEPTLGAREIAVDGPLLRRLYRTCDFEGVVVLVLALTEPNPFRVFTLADPGRVVVDVRR